MQSVEIKQTQRIAMETNPLILLTELGGRLPLQRLSAKAEPQRQPSDLFTLPVQVCVCVDLFLDKTGSNSAWIFSSSFNHLAQEKNWKRMYFKLCLVLAGCGGWNFHRLQADTQGQEVEEQRYRVSSVQTQDVVVPLAITLLTLCLSAVPTHLNLRAQITSMPRKHKSPVLPGARRRT